MFERYTEKARRTIFFARYEASQFGSSTIETEHLLLGLFREDQSLMGRLLGEDSAKDLPAVEVPSEIVEAQGRIRSIVRRMESAIAAHDFQEARACSDEERRERGNLRELCEKYKLTDTSGGLIPENGLLGDIRQRIESLTQRRPKISTSVDLPLSHESKRALTYGAEEAERMNQAHIETEHLFLGLLRVEDSLAARVLRERGLNLEEARTRVAGHLPEEGRPPRPARNFGPRPARGSGRMYGLQDAARVAFLARYEAVNRQSPCIETTDLLLALTREKEVNDRFLGPAQSAIRSLKPEPRREHVAATELAFSEDCKLVFRYTAEEAAQLGQRTGPEHLLLGILRVETCAAAEILRDGGLTVAGIRAQLSSPPPSSDPGLSSGPQGRNYV